MFLVSSFLESTFGKGTFDLRDKTVLAFDRAAVDALEIVTKDQRLAFVKTGRSSGHSRAPSRPAPTRARSRAPSAASRHWR